ncbi:hypothetical protein EDC01DRAFT_628151 [Geopyxis carbonaria]|nr:hypothetical protein EDC01DRAFT_628151 [Geopyxis carbonaria]
MRQSRGYLPHLSHAASFDDQPSSVVGHVTSWFSSLNSMIGDSTSALVIFHGGRTSALITSNNADAIELLTPCTINTPINDNNNNNASTTPSIPCTQSSPPSPTPANPLLAPQFPILYNKPPPACTAPFLPPRILPKHPTQDPTPPTPLNTNQHRNESSDGEEDHGARRRDE